MITRDQGHSPMNDKSNGFVESTLNLAQDSHLLAGDQRYNVNQDVLPQANQLMTTHRRSLDPYQHQNEPRPAILQSRGQQSEMTHQPKSSPFAISVPDSFVTQPVAPPDSSRNVHQPLHDDTRLLEHSRRSSPLQERQASPLQPEQSEYNRPDNQCATTPLSAHRQAHQEIVQAPEVWTHSQTTILNNETTLPRHTQSTKLQHQTQQQQLSPAQQQRYHRARLEHPANTYGEAIAPSNIKPHGDIAHHYVDVDDSSHFSNRSLHPPTTTATATLSLSLHRHQSDQSSSMNRVCTGMEPFPPDTPREIVTALREGTARGLPAGWTCIIDVSHKSAKMQEFLLFLLLLLALLQ
jgi:hypothetical protein